MRIMYCRECRSFSKIPEAIQKGTLPSYCPVCSGTSLEESYFEVELLNLLSSLTNRLGAQ